jgi:hypothetical protein
MINTADRATAEQIDQANATNRTALAFVKRFVPAVPKA